MPYKLFASGLSDKGLVRENNEDVWGEVPEIHLYILADGMGGHQAGEVASKEAVAAVCKSIKKFFSRRPKPSRDELATALRHAIEEANSIVYQMGFSNEQLTGMGTTLCALQFFGEDQVAFAHVGDSRIYRLRDGKLEQITNDHSLLQELMELGQVGQYQVAEFLYKNILTRAIGTEPAVNPTISNDIIKQGDIYLMCSDGLSDLLFLEEIESIIKKAPSLKDAVNELVANAKDKGGYDNITVVLVQVKS